MSEAHEFETDAGQWIIFHDGEHSLRDNFERFHRDNPHVYRTLVRLTRDWEAARPGRPCGMRMLFEVARWSVALETVGEPIKLNNNYVSYYARKLMTENPEFVGVFKLRRQKA